MGNDHQPAGRVRDFSKNVTGWVGSDRVKMFQILAGRVGAPLPDLPDPT